ncbi:uncharacterized protein EV422DRAFT_307840 [Fimicolochytrium jonesii]|uniref:uncharacterized protein n=1 Tax=Fimicolochytrium jonesii TaxID=1396493 RepID=UPI0022FE6F92|nr:uncharacterized protein EV422DRAFT_307840 [Fimicolochytrium jonesii]KAI8824133.1 hypothetical protein EV422DRAFT_307840 [Fimicolochytrium jonesii]
METDQDMGTQNSRARVEGIKVDFSSLKAAYKEDGSDEMDTDFQDLIRNLTNEIEKLAPNMRAIDKLDEVEGKLKDTAIEFDNARKEAKAAKDAFVKIKQERYELAFVNGSLVMS